MHELPIIKKVLATTLRYAQENEAKKVVSVTLEVGETHDLIADLVMKYFHYASRNTIAKDAELIYHTLPIVCQCGQCSEHFVFHLRSGIRTEFCPVCGSDSFTFVSGNEFFIDNIEIC